MHLKFRNVNTAFTSLVSGIHKGTIATVASPSRVGDVLVIEEPVTITYELPRERVLFNEARDANPFFHLYESLWMLAGRNDVAPLDYYCGNYGKTTSDDGVTANGAYGYRWRNHHIAGIDAKRRSASYEGCVDQLTGVIDLLRRLPESRRCVLSMWNIEDDFLKAERSKDVCCNLSVLFLIRNTVNESVVRYGDKPQVRVLDMTVINRSNDLVWGSMGANVVHFSFLQEYLAAHLGLDVGVYNQFSNNLHVYTERWHPKEWLEGQANRDMYSPRIWSYEKDVKTVVPLINDLDTFEEELPSFVNYNAGTPQLDYRTNWREPFFAHVAQPMLYAFHFYKRQLWKDAECELGNIIADDWRIAATSWIRKRKKKWKEKNAQQQQSDVSVESHGP